PWGHGSDEFSPHSSSITPLRPSCHHSDDTGPDGDVSFGNGVCNRSRAGRRGRCRGKESGDRETAEIAHAIPDASCTNGPVDAGAEERHFPRPTNSVPAMANWLLSGFSS